MGIQPPTMGRPRAHRKPWSLWGLTNGVVWGFTSLWCRIHGYGVSPYQENKMLLVIRCTQNARTPKLELTAKYGDRRTVSTASLPKVLASLKTGYTHKRLIMNLENLKYLFRWRTRASPGWKISSPEFPSFWATPIQFYVLSCQWRRDGKVK